MALPPRPHVLADASARVPGLQLDALAYVDTELDAPGMRERVDALILEEMARYPGPADEYASEMPPRSALATASASPLVQAELQRLAADAGSVLQPRVGGPSFAALPPAPTGPDAADPAAWRAAVDRAQAALEEQAGRAVNVELGARYAVETWKRHVVELDALAAVARTRASGAASQVAALNAARQAAQGPGGGGSRVKTLARRWAETAAANASAQLAVADASREAKRLRALAATHGLLDGEVGGSSADGAPGGDEHTGGTAAAAAARMPQR